LLMFFIFATWLKLQTGGRYGYSYSKGLVRAQAPVKAMCIKLMLNVYKKLTATYI
jgi:hypothetical protein